MSMTFVGQPKKMMRLNTLPLILRMDTRQRDSPIQHIKKELPETLLLSSELQKPVGVGKCWRRCNQCRIGPGLCYQSFDRFWYRRLAGLRWFQLLPVRVVADGGIRTHERYCQIDPPEPCAGHIGSPLPATLKAQVKPLR